MDLQNLLALLPTATLPTQTVVQMLSVIGQLANASNTYPLWDQVNKMLIAQAQAAEKAAAEKTE